jgi:CelD/BcsL family acetyltransferase involved in cellulose biosynthesis
LNLKKNQVTSINQGTVQVNVKLINKRDFTTLEVQWLQLEKLATTSFFLSWKWIGCWLNHVALDQEIYLITAKKGELIVGLGIFIEQNIVRHHFIKSKQWLLHRTGIETKDQIWIENNSFLLSSEGKSEINNAMWHYLLTNKGYVDEFIVYVAKKNSFINLDLPNKKYNIINELHELGYRTPLVGLLSLQDYLSQRSKNTRQQFNRSIKSLAKQGKIEFSIIQKTDEQIALFANAKQWHIEKWQHSSTPSGFNNEEFNLFHNNIITSSHPSAKTLMAKLTLDKQLIGCIYCLTHEKKVYFYLSCLKPFADNKIKLGLIIHILMIEWLISNNKHYSEYDFLAGDARYKNSLSTSKDEYLKLTIQRSAIKFRIEKKLKLIYKFLIK